MQYFTQITGIRETDKGTDLLLHIPGEMVRHKIIKYRNGSGINAEIRIDDGRTITNSQRAKIFATVQDIGLFTGDHPEDLRARLLYDYCIQTGEIPFSLSDCSISRARDYITFIIDFILRENIPLSDAALNRTDDIDKYLWGCLKYKRCAICGKEGETHHCTGSRIGMGNNRINTSNEGRELISLCRLHHTEIHTMPEEEFFKRYHVYGIVYNEKNKGD